jgi:arsenite methyltransferase
MTINPKTDKDAVKEFFDGFADRYSESTVPADTSRAKVFYTPKDLSGLSNRVVGISMGSGNPIAVANLKPDEIVLDLGSGGGIDCFLAAKAVGPTGRVIGVDMSRRMLALANNNKAELGLINVEFRESEIENLMIEDDTIDVVISNGTINLSPDKEAVFREAFRVLKPGGRFVVSDLVTDGDIPEQLRVNAKILFGIGVDPIDQTEFLNKLRQVGFVNVDVLQSNTFWGIENLEMLDENTREVLGAGVGWSTVPPNARYCCSDIVAHKPG